MKRKRPARAPDYTLEGALVQLAAIERQRPGQLASWLRVWYPPLQGYMPERAVFVSVVALRPACQLYMPDGDDEACSNCGRARSCHD